MSDMVICDLKTFWRKKEVEAGRVFTVAQVARETGISYDAVNRLKSGDTTRFDSAPLAKVCKFFGVPEGEPVPFLKVMYNNKVAQ